MEDLSLKEGDSFAEFNERFYKRFPDLTVFDCGEINLVKVVLDGLKVNYSSRWQIKTIIHKSRPEISLYFFIKSMRSESKPEVSGYMDRTLILDTGRTVSDTDFRLAYFENAIETLGENSVLIVSNQPNKAQRPIPWFLYNQVLSFRPKILRRRHFKFLDELRECLKKIKPIISDLDYLNISIAFQNFWETSIAWQEFVLAAKPRKCIMICHYHREAMIFALKSKGIEVVELQHGLISAKDIFYCFPESIKSIRDRSMFADKILLFGEYWDEVLSTGHEYPANSREVVGDFFTKSDKKQIEVENPDDIIILITSQTLLKEYFWEYTQSLALRIKTSGSRYQIWYKPHPVEYSDLSYCSVNNYPTIVEVKKNTLDDLFPFVDAQISIYSTCLIDGLKYGVKGFSINRQDCKDYIDEFINAGISELIEFEDTPDFTKKIWNGKNSENKYYRKLDGELFKEALL